MFMGGCIYTCYENFKQKTIPSTQITHLFALRTIQSGLLDTSEARKKYHERISQNTSSYQRVSARVVGSWPPAKGVHKGIISFHDSWPSCCITISCLSSMIYTNLAPYQQYQNNHLSC